MTATVQNVIANHVVVAAIGIVLQQREVPLASHIERQANRYPRERRMYRIESISPLVQEFDSSRDVAGFVKALSSIDIGKDDAN